MEPGDLEAFWTKLWASGAVPQCLSCGQTHWGDTTHVTAIPEFNPTTKELEYNEEFAAVAIVCETCGFVRFHKLDLEPEIEVEGGDGAAGR